MSSQNYPFVKDIEQCIVQGHEALDRGELVEATKYFVKARLLLTQAGVRDGAEMQHCLKALAAIYNKRSMPLEGVEIFRDLRQLDDSIENRRIFVTLLSQVAGQYHKQGDRERAEEAYAEALAEASELLPPDDPLIEQLNNAGIEFFKRTFKAQKLTVSDTNLKLARLQNAEAEEAQAVLSGQARRPAKKMPKIGDTSARESLKVGLSGASQVKRNLRSLVVLVIVGGVLLVSLAKASLFVSQARTAHAAAHKSSAGRARGSAAKSGRRGASRGGRGG